MAIYNTGDNEVIKFEYHGFKFEKIIEMEEIGVRFTVRPYLKNYAATKPIYSILIADESYLYDNVINDMTHAINEWIENETSELDKVFAYLKEI